MIESIQIIKSNNFENGCYGEFLLLLLLLLNDNIILFSESREFNSKSCKTFCT